MLREIPSAADEPSVLVEQRWATGCGRQALDLAREQEQAGGPVVCLVPLPRLQLCSRCKTARYCSK